MSNKADKSQTAKVENPSLTPKMRFPEFKQANSWEIKRLGQVLSIGNGRDYKHLSSGNVPVYGSGGYMLSVDDYLYDGESVCIGRKGTIDKPIFLSGKFWTVDTLFYTHSFKKCLPKFVYSIFQKIKWQDHNEAGGVPSLSKTNIEKIEVAIPTVVEQQKIADCLSSIDELISAVSQKLDSLKTHKRGLMQSLFPLSGETVPRLRFPQFQNDREWKKKKLDDFAKIVRGGSPRPIDDYITNDSDGLNWLKIGDIDKESKFVTSTHEKVIPAALAKTREVHPGDLILSNSMSFGRPYILKIKTCIHDGWIAISELDESIDRDYLYYLTMTAVCQTYFSNNAAGSGVQNLNADIIKLLPVLYPAKKEQQKIADCLSSIDELISAEAKKLDSLKMFKKGLMQQLFPSLHEELG